MLTKIASTLAFGVLALAISPGHSFASEQGYSAGGKAPTTIDRRRPRVPGGSGCDDPGDLIEHPECRGLKSGDADEMTISRRKPRVPGGSGL